MAAATSSSQRLPKTSLMQRRRWDAATGRLAPHRGPVKDQRLASSLIGEPLAKRSLCRKKPPSPGAEATD